MYSAGSRPFILCLFFLSFAVFNKKFFYEKFINSKNRKISKNNLSTTKKKSKHLCTLVHLPPPSSTSLERLSTSLHLPPPPLHLPSPTSTSLHFPPPHSISLPLTPFPSPSLHFPPPHSISLPLHLHLPPPTLHLPFTSLHLPPPPSTSLAPPFTSLYLPLPPLHLPPPPFRHRKCSLHLGVEMRIVHY